MRMTTFSGDDRVKTAYFYVSDVADSDVEIGFTEPDESPYVDLFTVHVHNTGPADLTNIRVVSHPDDDDPPETAILAETLPPDGYTRLLFATAYFHDVHVLANCASATTCEVRFVVH